MDDSPVKKKRKKKNADLNLQCLIHVDNAADDSTLSVFTDKSWKVSKKAKHLF